MEMAFGAYTALRGVLVAMGAEYVRSTLDQPLLRNVSHGLCRRISAAANVNPALSKYSHHPLRSTVMVCSATLRSNSTLPSKGHETPHLRPLRASCGRI